MGGNQLAEYKHFEQVYILVYSNAYTHLYLRLNTHNKEFCRSDLIDEGSGNLYYI